MSEKEKSEKKENKVKKENYTNPLRTYEGTVIGDSKDPENDD